MNDLEQKIKEIISRDRIWPSEMISVKEFIRKCSMQDFEKLKKLDHI